MSLRNIQYIYRVGVIQQVGKLKNEKRSWKLLRDFCKPQRVSETALRCLYQELNLVYTQSQLKPFHHNPPSPVCGTSVCHPSAERWRRGLIPRWGTEKRYDATETLQLSRFTLWPKGTWDFAFQNTQSELAQDLTEHLRKARS